MDTCTFAVYTDDSSIARSSSGQVAGVIYVTFDGTTFPGAGWSDSIVAVLRAWLEGLSSFTADASESLSLHFMDGPFRIDISWLGPKWHLQFHRVARHSTIVGECSVDPDDMKRSVAEAARRTLEVCSQKAWWSPDLDALAQLTKIFLKDRQ